MMLYRGAFAIVDLSAIQSNIRNIKSRLLSTTKMLVAVKADGYGHGATPVANAVLKAGATHLGVASLEEGLALRSDGISAPILILGVIPPEAARVAAQNQIDIAVSTDWNRFWDALGDSSAPGSLANVLGLQPADPPLRIHLKIDTGMSRIGFRAEDEIVRWAKRIAASDGVELTGLFTHLACADAPTSTSADAQIEKLRRIEQTLVSEGVRPRVVHAANSAATLLGEPYHFDMVRVGISAYGYRSSVQFDSPVPLDPALNLYAFLTRIAVIEAGEAVGYGGTFVAKRQTVVGTVPVGYGDGYPRWLSNRGSVVVHGQMAPVIGRVCMDQIMVDLTDVDEVHVGDCVCLYGRYAPSSWSAGTLWGGLAGHGAREQSEWLLRTFQQETSPANLLSLDSLAEIGNTISYELMCALSFRIPRLYLPEK